ncbi:MAG: hypothetical protein PHY93_08545 [Bacteriovorax sp.]|nr:hypothetical protein [Bacteriovorax sp.]
MIQPLFPQVHKAVNEMMQTISNMPDARLYQLLAPMQSGKTQFIIEMYLRFKQEFPNCMGLYIVGHNHKDFIDQNFTRLEYLITKDCYCLTLSERRQSKINGRPLKSFINDPILIFFDENHFADGIEQTIDRFLKTNKLYANKNVYLVCVSATPFSSVAQADETTVMYDSMLMPTYKSVSMMLKRGDIFEASPILKKEKDKFRIIDDSPAYKAMKDVILKKDHGYIILRTSKKAEADYLIKELTKRFPKKVHVRHWNQSKQMSSPGDFFNAYCPDNITIVIVQQKARMGNTIPTKFVHMVYDYSPNASIATIAQGLLGRCCGHGKINDQVKVFTHLKQAEAYSLFENGLFEDFYAFVDEHQLKTSQRSEVELTTGITFATEVLESKSLDRNIIVKQVRDHLGAKFGENPMFDDSMVVHRLSKNKMEKEGIWYQNIIDNPLNDAGRKKLSRHPKKVSVLVDDRRMPCRVFAAFRYESNKPTIGLIPKPTSIYNNIEANE